MHVLIADDDPVTRTVVRAAVERLGQSCAVAEDGDEAWRRFQAEPPGSPDEEIVRVIRSSAGW